METSDRTGCDGFAGFFPATPVYDDRRQGQPGPQLSDGTRLRLIMALEDILIDWDGKSAEFLRDAYERFSPEESFVDDALFLACEPKLQTSATWLIKHHLEQGGSLSAKQRTKLFRSLKSLQDWESKLHVLQCLPTLKLTKRQAEQSIDFLRACTEDSNKFVRAWAFGGMHVLSEQHGEYREEAEQKIAWASENEAPSVRARIRQVLGKKGKRSK